MTELLLDDRELLKKLEEVRDLLEGRSGIETVSDGDDPIWVLDQAIERLS
jgi:hypothetical protein